MPRSLLPPATLACLLLSAAVARAQAPSPPDTAAAPNQPAYTLHTNTRLVLTDVTVTDRSGNPVHNLPSSAFHIFDGSTPQDIASFEEHTSSTLPISTDTSASPRAKDVYSNDILLHVPPVLNVVVLDLTNVVVEDQMYLNFQLTRFLDNLPHGQMLAIYGRFGPATVQLQGFTSDHTLLLAAVHRIIPRFPPTGAAYLSDIDTLHQIASSLRDLPGRKNVLWFSGGSALFLRPDATQFQDVATWRRVYDELEADRIAVYPIDARGLTVASDAVGTSNIPNLPPRVSPTFSQHAQMSDVAEATGGRAFYNNNGLQQIAAKITSTGSDFYTLSYLPRNYREDKKWHKVHIALDGAPYTLSYRRGYFADGVNTSPAHPAGSLTRVLADGNTSSSLPPSHSAPIVFEARVLPSSDPATPFAPESRAKPRRGAIPYTIHYTVPANNFTVSPVNGKSTMDVIVAAMAINGYGSVLDQHIQRTTFSVNEANLGLHPTIGIPFDQHFQLAKGEVYLLLAVIDVASNRSGNLQVSLQVPAPEKPPQAR